MKKIIFIVKCIIIILIGVSSKVSAQQAWVETGNNLSALTTLLGSRNNFGFNVITNNKDRISFNSRGQIGIGTNLITNTLCLSGGLSLDIERLNNGSLDNALRLASLSRAGISSPQQGSRANLQGISFYTDNIERLAITAGANIGIGTTYPSARLEVRDGDIKTSGTVNAADFNVQGNINAVSFHAGANIRTDNEFNISSGRVTGPGNANMLPVAFVKVNKDGNIISSSGNVVVVNTNEAGKKLIGITGASIDNSFIVIATVCSEKNAIYSTIAAMPDGNGMLTVKIGYLPVIGPIDAVLSHFVNIPSNEDFSVVFFHP